MMSMHTDVLHENVNACGDLQPNKSKNCTRNSEPERFLASDRGGHSFLSEQVLKWRT